MKALLSFSTALILLFPCAFAQAESVWQIQASSASESIQCTASLIRTNDRCVLLTAAHCLPENLSSLRIENENRQSEESKVVRKSRFFDLAEISIPRSFAQNVKDECAASTVSGTKDVANLFTSLKATGYVAGELVRRYTKDLDWDNGAEGLSEIEIQYTANSLQEYLYTTKDLFIVPGMSGGLVQDSNGSVFGIISQYVPNTGNLYIVPIQTILRFASGEMPTPELENLSGIPTLSHFLSRNNLTRGAGNDGHVGGGNDGHVGGGNDGHVGGGNDGHVGGGNDGHVGGGDDGVNSHDPMALFREPIEGIDDPENPGKRLMAVNGKQIDGTDDYAMIYLSLQATDRARARKIFLQDRLARGILGRMNGYYVVSSARDFGKEILYSQSTPVTSGDLLTNVIIDAKKKKIMLIFSLPLHVEQLISGTTYPQEKLVWDVVLDNSGMPLRLVSGSTTLECDHREYLQLLCSNADADMSFSLNEDRKVISSDDWLPPKLHFRYTRRLILQGKPYYDYRFGDGVDLGVDPAEWWEQ